MEGEEFEELVADIKANGLIEDIVLFEGMILDGRNRYRACIAADFPPVTLNGDKWIMDPAAYVVSANLRRRHLTQEQKRELIAKLVKAQPEKSNRQIAKVVKVDHKMVGTARAKLAATGEIPQLKKTVGADGKRRPSKSKQVGAAKSAADRTIEDAIVDTMASEIEIGGQKIEIMRSKVATWERHRQKNREILKAEVERLAEKLAKSDPESARTLHEILAQADPLLVLSLQVALERGLGIEQDHQEPTASHDDGLDIPEYLRREAVR
jgi:hypothetical protein